eukprot:1189351-Prorocentrum_minimum.AAC.3
MLCLQRVRADSVVVWARGERRRAANEGSGGDSRARSPPAHPRGSVVRRRGRGDASEHPTALASSAAGWVWYASASACARTLPATVITSSRGSEIGACASLCRAARVGVSKLELTAMAAGAIRAIEASLVSGALGPTLVCRRPTSPLMCVRVGLSRPLNDPRRPLNDPTTNRCCMVTVQLRVTPRGATLRPPA